MRLTVSGLVRADRQAAQALGLGAAAGLREVLAASATPIGWRLHMVAGTELAILGMKRSVESLRKLSCGREGLLGAISRH